MQGLDTSFENKAALERKESILDSVETPCQQCFALGDLQWQYDDLGGVWIVCGCGCGTGIFDTHEKAIAVWCGNDGHEPHGSQKRDEVWNHIVDKFEANDANCWTSAEYQKNPMQVLNDVLAIIWNNEIPGVRFECGGANTRRKGK